MKVIILQSMYDSRGGIYFVNKELMRMFHEKNYEISLVSLRMSGSNQKLDYPDYIDDIIINESKMWGVTRLRTVIDYVKNFHFIKASRLFFTRVKESRALRADYKKTKEIIRQINPDFIINSHYELLDAIPNDYLSKTIMHFHTNFGIVKDNWSYQKIFNKYKNKLYKFVWLSKATEEEAKSFGYLNSTHIYNSVRVQSNIVANVWENKSLVFFGRLSKEKRLDIILDIFSSISSEFPDWTLNIYGIGSLNDNEREVIDSNKQIHFWDATDDLKKVFMSSSININTSDYEGFSMTILEANEFGVPTIAFRFGESVDEEILHEETGMIIEKDNVNAYKEVLVNLMNDKKLLENLSSNCKSFNKQFSYDIIKKEWIRLLEGERND